jgi:hypothetical protein
MLRLLWGSSQVIILVLGLLIIDGAVDAEDQRAIVIRISMPHLSGTDVLVPAITAITNHAGQLVIDQTAAEAYLISHGDIQRAFIDTHLVTIADDTAAPVNPSLPSPTQKSANIEVEVKETVKQPGISTSPSSSTALATTAPAQSAPTPVTKSASPAAQPAAPKPATAKPQSILQMIEGHEAEFKIGVLIAAGSFVLGWICGGSYYVRRERRRRGKLRF